MSSSGRIGCDIARDRERARKAVALLARRLRLEMESRCGQAKGGGGDVVLDSRKHLPSINR